ncbi:MAG: pilus assembly FimT family protein [Burkholderiaceae bacterium]|jgi:Tfp pilus assembly protein FimT
MEQYGASRRSGRHRSRGLSLPEILVTIGVSSTLLALGIPRLSELQQERRLRGAAEAASAEIRLTHSHAIKVDEAMMISFRSNGDASAWCVAPRGQINCDCLRPDGCSAEVMQSTLRADGFPGVSMSSNVTQGVLSVQPRRGTITAGSIDFSIQSGKQLRVVINGYGRTRVCVPPNGKPVTGYWPC